jgi:L-2-hydroxyglutarate oxidase
LVQAQGGVVKTGVACQGIRYREGAHCVETNEGEFEARYVVNCGGLQSDRIARQAGLKPEASILPFRGEYFELAPNRRHLVKTLIYPVPDPEFPFLGVHLTRMIDGSIHAGPNAVLAFKREGYHKTDINLGDLYEILTFPGFWKMARKHFRMGLMEMYRSLSRKAFLKSLQRLVPDINDGDLVPTHSGVRAQALMPDGKLVDDFLIVNGRNSIHVCNAPSPAATASLKIGEVVAEKLLGLAA